MDDDRGTASLDSVLGTSGSCLLLSGTADTPAGLLVVEAGAVRLGDAEAARLEDGGVRLGGVRADLDAEPARPGAWRRPAPLHVRGPGGGRVLVECGALHELHPGGRAESTPLVVLRPDGGGLHLSWSRNATPRDLALAALLVLAPPQRS